MKDIKKNINPTPVQEWYRDRVVCVCLCAREDDDELGAVGTTPVARLPFGA